MDTRNKGRAAAERSIAVRTKREFVFVKKIVRIVGKPKKNDEHNLSITIELGLDNGKMEDKKVFFGFLGALRDDSELYPFIVYADGRIDFGSDNDESFRYGRTTLRERKIEVGTLFSVDVAYGEPLRHKEFTYEISQIVDLLK